jgi:hypothetical protein
MSYDLVIKNGTVIDGNNDAWVRLWRAATNGFTSTADYFRVQGRNPDGTVNPAYENLLDMTNLVDFLLTIIYAGDWDGPIYQNLLNGYLKHLHRATHRDPVVYGAFARVMHLLASPFSLLAPHIAFRVLLTARNRSRSERTQVRSRRERVAWE